MKRILIQIPVLFLGAISLSTSSFAQTTERHIVKQVIDGDTIELQDGAIVRYIGIDTPESVDTSKPVGYYAPEAANANKKLVEGKKVRLEYDEERTDRYGRTLAYVYVDYNGKEIFVNAFLVLNGYARAVRYPPNTKYADLFTANQNEAYDFNRGVWAVEEDHRAHVSPQNEEVNKEVAVFFTKSGAKYHLAGCRYLLGGSIAITLENAKKILEPCKVCKPQGR